MNYVNLALTEVAARLKDDRPVGVSDIARAVGCTPENLNQSKRFVQHYKLLSRAMARAVRGRKVDGRVEADFDLDEDNNF